MTQFIDPARRIPGVDAAEQPLSPCSPGKARQLLESGRAKPYKHPDGFTIQLLDKVIPPVKFNMPEPQAHQDDTHPA